MTENRRNIYPYFIVLLLGTFLVFLFWSGNRAATRGSRITDPDYYSKGLKYNTTLVEKKAASVLGWQLHSNLQDYHLRVTLLDSDHQPVTGAHGILLLHDAKHNRSESHTLQESSAGLYQLLLPTQLSGQLQARIEFECDGARLNRQLLISL